ncbi:DNA repair protein [Komagataella phaffii CBS 7435]|uniref:DNA repair and recombination protein RAD52 n=2 Tax=Komagataella phaffii TaxID=460519 RepID=C4R6T9_KOMPG|nr:Protein involved in the repair of double-strand breaks in DNA during vegetative growth [Komagataella phaffii GS115]AOA64451.1 GQ67_04396T0 [Komagataella phaffii]CAH2451342.1 DNA repair protein [Komagataella phaffii CBS 7435]AOA69684.1 GQ68_04368T0 [Komagataella phaffii GS115]CAY71314.1 Protein involved in the repair of double-strand breaks in DNA during vegetative growth [Komagataella phaffii GS115]CCA41080.1 DNA repair protein [Komagataella phaffii CBS 7435]
MDSSDSESLDACQSELFPKELKFDLFDDFSIIKPSEWAITRIGWLQTKIDRLHRSRNSVQRRYLKRELENQKLISTANQVFGFNGWSSVLDGSFEMSECAEEDGRFKMKVLTTVKLILKDGTTCSATGTGRTQNASGRAQALSKCKKEAINDAIRRCIESLPNLLLESQDRKQTFKDY